MLFAVGDYGYLDGVAVIGPNNSKAYGLVEAPYATTNQFSHEVGHLFGGRHHNDNDGSIEHGYQFKTGWFIFKHKRNTVMYATYDASRKIDYFSNPYVNYKGESTGTVNHNFNVLKMQQTGSSVKSFRPYTPPPDVTISGTSFGENDIQYTWTANYCRGTGTGSPSYRWEQSLDGVYYTLAGTQSSLTQRLPYYENLHLRLTITFSNGDQAVAFKMIYNNSVPPGGCDPVLEAQAEYKKLRITPCLKSAWATFYPNPVKDELTIEYY